ncbi:MAG: 50S ribosomal protein L29 [Gammaproteobacteria bacterium]|nr:50S ribosomal protein L29 [Gammaproteobacteria bacterium]
MEVQALRECTDEELREELMRLTKEQFNLRMQKANGQLGQTHLIGEARREIARVKTVLVEKASNVSTQTDESKSDD